MPDEKARMETWADSVRNAIRHKWTFKLTDLNLAAYKLGSGAFEGDDDMQRLLDDLQGSLVAPHAGTSA